GWCPAETAHCDDGDPCTSDLLISAGTCSARCLHQPIVTVDDGDGCCPLAADATTDRDCPASCGNGIREPGERCDTRITTAAGGCPAACPPPPAACVRYLLQGTAASCSAACVATPISACSLVADGCCPTGCVAGTDPDCSARCGNGTVDPGESCDTAIAAGAG